MVECLPSKWKALSSNASIAGKKKWSQCGEQGVSNLAGLRFKQISKKWIKYILRMKRQNTIDL
jgi:hypothetical protein